MLPEFKIYYKNEMIHDEKDFFVMLMANDDYNSEFSPLIVSDYEIEFADRFVMNLPKGNMIIFESDGSGIMLSERDAEMPFNLTYLQLEPEEIYEGEELRDVQQRVLDDLSKISEEGLGIVTVLNVGDIMISYTLLPKLNQVKFSINTKENIFLGYSFIFNDKSIVENKELIETWFSEIGLSKSINKVVDASVEDILTEAYHQIQSANNELLNVVHNNEFIAIDNNIRIPVFKDFGVLRDMIQYKTQYSDDHTILPLIMAEDSSVDFSISSAALSTKSITVFPDWIKYMQEKNPRFRGNFHKNKNNTLKFFEKSNYINVHSIQVDGLEMIIGQLENLQDFFTVRVNGGDFMYTIHCYLPYSSIEVSNLEIVEAWLNRFQRIVKIKS